MPQVKEQFVIGNSYRIWCSRNMVTCFRNNIVLGYVTGGDIPKFLQDVAELKKEDFDRYCFNTFENQGV